MWRCRERRAGPSRAGRAAPPAGDAARPRAAPVALRAGLGRAEPGMQGKGKLLVVHNGRMVSARGAGAHPPGLPRPAARRELGAGQRCGRAERAGRR